MSVFSMRRLRAGTGQTCGGERPLPGLRCGDEAAVCFETGGNSTPLCVRCGIKVLDELDGALKAARAELWLCPGARTKEGR